MTPITKQSLEQLKEKARAATLGDRIISRVRDSDGLCEVSIHMDEGEETLFSMNLGSPNYESDAKFAAAASPDVILDLIARVEGLSEALQEIMVRNCFHGESKTFCTCIAKSAIERFGVK